MYKFAIVEDVNEDNDEFARLIKKAWPDAKVQQYFSYEQIAKDLTEHEFDLVVSDIDLGGGERAGGVRVTVAVSKTNTPIVIVSGSAQADLQRDTFRALNAWDYLQKPVTEADFITQCQRAIAFRQAYLNSKPPLALSHGIGDLVVDMHSRDVVKWKGRRVSLSVTQIFLLNLLIKKVGEVVSFDQFFEQVDSGKNKENLRAHIREMRNYFRDVDHEFDKIKNKYMLGYYWGE